MTTLVEFLRARLAEDELVARECAGAPWTTPIPGQVHVDAKAIADNKLALGKLGYVATVLHEQDRQHIARHDPARVLREVEAKRRIVDLHRSELIEAKNADGDDRSGYWCAECDYETFPCPTLRLLALPYATHPDYREEWRP